MSRNLIIFINFFQIRNGRIERGERIKQASHLHLSHGQTGEKLSFVVLCHFKTKNQMRHLIKILYYLKVKKKKETRKLEST
jgi:hypothetical protein